MVLKLGPTWYQSRLEAKYGGQPGRLVGCCVRVGRGVEDGQTYCGSPSIFRFWAVPAQANAAANSIPIPAIAVQPFRLISFMSWLSSPRAGLYQGCALLPHTRPTTRAGARGAFFGV